MEKEYNSLLENQTWELFDRPKGAKIKDKFKARLVARGNEQKKGMDYDEVFAPVARHDSIRTLLASAVQCKMHVHHMDVVTAYVQGKLSDTVYMYQAELFVEPGKEEKVCKLNRPLYGLKQAGREWYQTLNEYLHSINLRKSPLNPCVYISQDNSANVILIVYVDDILVAAKNLEELIKIKKVLKNKFKMNDLGKVTNILGIQVNREGDTGNIKISQRRYIEEALTKFGMENCKSALTPLVPNKVFNQVTTGSQKMENVPYRELTGTLTYLSNATRPDIAYAASTLSQFNASPTTYHWKAAKQVLRYLKSTIDFGITYSRNDKELEMYVDSNWAGDESDRRSRYGYVAMLANGPISWESKKQMSVAVSTMEAEYMGLSEAAKEVVYLKRLLLHMNLRELASDKINIYCDNQSAVQLSKNNVFHRRSKHIDIRFHYTRELQENDEINVGFISSNEMIADILTKSLPKIKLYECIDLMGLRQ